MWKKFSIIFTFLLLFQTITPGLAAPVKVDAWGNDIIDEGVIEDEDAEETAVTFNWSVNGQEVKKGDTAQAQIPSKFKNEDSAELADPDGVIELFSIEDNTINIQFNSDVEEKEKASGNVVVDVVNLDVREQNKGNTDDGTVELEGETETPGEEVVNSEGEDATGPDSNKNESDSDDNNADNPVAENDAGQNGPKKDENSNKEENPADEEEEADVESDSNGIAMTPTAPIEDGEKHGFTLKLNNATDMDGNHFDEDHQLGLDDEFYLDLEWDLEDGHNHVEGDVQTFQLPNGIKIQEEFEIELKSDGLDVAHAVIKTDGTVELTFTNFVETHNEVKGYMKIVSMIDEENAEVEDGEIILNPIGDEGIIKIPIDLGDREKTIEKKGTPNKGYNADEINWEVTINKMKNDLTNAKVTDVLPEGTEYKEGSLKVTKLKVDIHGNVLGDLEEVDITSASVDSGTLKIPLGSIKDAYKIEYVTTVTDDEQKTFKNNATLLDDELEDISTDATATINRGDPIKKSAATGYNPKTGIIEWEIQFNFNQKDLSDITLKDAWTPEGTMHLVEESLKFQEVSIDENGNAHNEGEAINLPEGAELVNGEDQFEVTGITTDKAYKVTYQTKVNDRVLDGFDVSNTAGFGNESDGSGTGVGKYYGSKSAGKVDYKDKTIDWTIELNHDEYPMEKISISDTLGDGLTLDEDSIEITVDGDEYTGGYTVSDDNPFELKFPEEFTTDKKIVIKYKTDFVADEVTNNLATNKADITWTPEGGSDSITKEVEADTPLNTETEDNSWKNGSYNPETKEITWTIYANYRENQIDDLKIKDEPQGNQQIIADSAVVTELEIAGNGNITEGNTLDSASTIDVDNNTLEVNIGDTNKAYKIEYKTSLEGLSDIQKEYVNKADILDGDILLSEIDAKVGIAKAHTYGAKSGKQDGKQVHWAVTVNPGQQKVKSLKLEDTVSDNQDILNDTFKVYEADVDGNGNAAKKGEPISSDQYELTHEEGEPTFTVKWNNTVERAYIVEYSTLFFAGHNEDVTNSYGVTGDNIVDGGETGGSGSVKIKQFGTGSGEGTAGYLIIDKVDTTDGGSEKLEGAEFDLIDADTGNVLKSGITDENGQIDFGRLLYGDYILHETRVPSGLVNPNPDEKETITIDKKYNAESDKTEYKHTVENYVPVFAIELFKVDDEGNALAGAEFTLYDLDNKKLATKETDEEGKILFGDLEVAGTYYVQETKAPAGYVHDDTKHKVIVGDKEQKPVKVTKDPIQNNVRGNVVLTKIDVDTEVPLEGVQFELQKKNDLEEYEKVGEIYTTDENGQIQTENTLEAGEYRFVEETPLPGYQENEDYKAFTIDASETETIDLTMSNEQIKGSLTLKKSDAKNHIVLEGAVFKLVDSEGNIVEENLVTNSSGEIKVDNLFLGKYQFIETEAPDGYILDETPIDVVLTEKTPLDFADVRNHQITEISVEKKWNNGEGDTIPVTVKLLPTGETIELNDGNDWKATFENLRVFDDSEEEIDYTIEELDVDDYNAKVTGNAANGFTITNTETTNVSGTKIWKDDNEADRPDSINVNLKRNNEGTVETAEVNADNGWKFSFDNLDKYDSEGELYEYEVTEQGVDGYNSEVNGSQEEGFVITNTRSEKRDITVTKGWNDNNFEGRPDSITGELFQNNEPFKDFELSNDNNWKQTFEGLKAYDSEGKAYVYTVSEETVDGYTTIVDGFDITNELILGDVELIKVDKRNNDRKLKGAIFDLQDQDGNAIETGLTTDKDGKIALELQPGDYQFVETKAPSGYRLDKTPIEFTVELGQTGTKTFEMENTRRPVTPPTPDPDPEPEPEIDISGTKSWEGDSSSDRPASITVNLLQNGEKIDSVKVTAGDNWEYSFTDVDSVDDSGNKYKYTVEEVSVDDYESTVDGFDITNVKESNSEVSGTKTWEGDKSSDRPSSITVNLLQNGEKMDSAKVTAGDNWKYSFTNLDEFDKDGNAYEYTIEEEAIEDYETTVDGFNITNTFTGTTEVTGTKTWVDDNAADRPDAIKINLHQNNVVVDTVTVTKADDWKYSFTDLEKYDADGKAYDYTITEQGVPGYDSSVDGYDITNTRSETTSVSVTKGWKDDNADDRPTSITVNLLQNGEVIDTVQITSTNGWIHTFNNLDAFDENGIAYTYTVEEEAVEGYETIVDGYDITNVSTDEPEPEDPTDPEEPGEEDPDKPGTEDPEQPGGEDSDDPDGGVEGDEDEGNGDGSDPSLKPDYDENNGTNNGLTNVDGDQNENKGNMLPQTGEDKFFMMIALGTLFVIAGGALLFRRVRKEN